MALQINVSLTAKGGLTIPTGSIVKFVTIFPENGTEMHCNLKVYKDASTVATREDIYPKELSGKMGIVKQLSEGDYTSLTPVMVHTWLKAELEAIAEIGVGNVVII